MKKSLIFLFATLLMSSLCFAEQTPVTASDVQGKVVENKKPVKTMVKKSGKKVQKATKPVQKVTEPIKK